MTASVRSELLKFFTTRLWWGMAIAVFVSGAAFAVLFGILLTMEVPEGQGFPVGDATQIANSVYTGGIGVGYLLMLTIGVLQIGMEYRHQTITSTFLAEPKRWRPMLAKVVALLLIGAMYGVLNLVGSLGLGALTLHLRGGDPWPSADVGRTLLLSLLVLGLWALIGLGVGILLKNPIAALLIGIGVAWIVEPIAGLALKQWGFAREHLVPYLPSEATNAIVNAVSQDPTGVRLDWWAAALALTAWAALLSGFGILRAIRQDVS